jgi:DNA-binding IclR family transcriptional regulator
MAEKPLLIQSVDRAISSLDIISGFGQQGIGLKDLSQRLGVNASTTHHILVTLIAHQLVEQDPSSKRYRLGIHLIELGNIALSNTSLATVARPYLDHIWDATGHTVSLLIFHGLLRTPLFDVRSRQMITVNSTPLDVSTLHATGSGKLLLAFLPEQELRTYLSTVRLERYTGHTLTDPDGLCDEIVRIREEGVSHDREEYSNGVRCISVPVQDASRRTVACIDMVFPTFEADDERTLFMTETMQKAAFELSSQLQAIGLVVP